jgi:hypothetical protein
MAKAKRSAKAHAEGRICLRCNPQVELMGRRRTSVTAILGCWLLLSAASLASRRMSVLGFVDVLVVAGIMGASSSWWWSASWCSFLSYSSSSLVPCPGQSGGARIALALRVHTLAAALRVARRTCISCLHVAIALCIRKSSSRCSQALALSSGLRKGIGFRGLGSCSRSFRFTLAHHIRTLHSCCPSHYAFVRCVCFDAS